MFERGKQLGSECPSPPSELRVRALTPMTEAETELECLLTQRANRSLSQLRNLIHRRLRFRMST
jgi:hypothetical protein